jgi:hypothetical protein
MEMAMRRMLFVLVLCISGCLDGVGPGVCLEEAPLPIARETTRCFDVDELYCPPMWAVSCCYWQLDSCNVWACQDEDGCWHAGTSAEYGDDERCQAGPYGDEVARWAYVEPVCG